MDSSLFRLFFNSVEQLIKLREALTVSLCHLREKIAKLGIGQILFAILAERLDLLLVTEGVLDIQKLFWGHTYLPFLLALVTLCRASDFDGCKDRLPAFFKNIAKNKEFLDRGQKACYNETKTAREK